MGHGYHDAVYLLYENILQCCQCYDTKCDRYIFGPSNKRGMYPPTFYLYLASLWSIYMLCSSDAYMDGGSHRMSTTFFYHTIFPLKIFQTNISALCNCSFIAFDAATLDSCLTKLHVRTERKYVLLRSYDRFLLGLFSAQ